MTTVGYGDVYAVSPFGRCISIINALWGAFLISMLVASMGKIFELSDNQKRAIAEITNSKNAAKSLKASFFYYMAKKELKTHNAAVAKGEIIENEDYIPTKPEIDRLKDKMEAAADKMRNERLANSDLTPIDTNGNNIEIVKEQILDLNDKFDFLIQLMIKGRKIGAQMNEGEKGVVIEDFNLG